MNNDPLNTTLIFPTAGTGMPPPERGRGHILELDLSYDLSEDSLWNVTLEADLPRRQVEEIIGMFPELHENRKNRPSVPGSYRISTLARYRIGDIDRIVTNGFPFSAFLKGNHDV